VRHYLADLPYSIQVVSEASWVLGFGYFIAYLETLAISSVRMHFNLVAYGFLPFNTH